MEFEHDPPPGNGEFLTEIDWNIVEHVALYRVISSQAFSSPLRNEPFTVRFNTRESQISRLTREGFE